MHCTIRLAVIGAAALLPAFTSHAQSTATGAGAGRGTPPILAERASPVDAAQVAEFRSHLADVAATLDQLAAWLPPETQARAARFRATSGRVGDDDVARFITAGIDFAPLGSE